MTALEDRIALSSDRDAELLTFIREFWDLHGYGPSIREAGLACRFHSTNGVRWYITRLRKAGLVTSAKGIARSLRLTDKGLAA